MKVANAQQMRELDKLASEEYGIPSLILMENAGLSVALAAVDMVGGDIRGALITVLAGSGNNGGDGFVAARHLHNFGALVTIVYFGDMKKAKGDAKVNLQIVDKMNLIIFTPDESSSLSSFIKESDLIIDALIGTGIKGELKPEIQDVIRDVNSFGNRVISVDIPSGVNSDNGEICTDAVWADLTVTFALPKIGLVTFPGAERVGQLVVADISIPNEALVYNDCNTYLLDNDAVRAAVPDRPENSHKGSYGHAAIIAGSVGMTGAAVLTASGALRIGTGLVTVAIPSSLNDILEAKLTEAMTVPVEETLERTFGKVSVDKVLAMLETKNSAVIGPGLGRSDETSSFVSELLEKIQCPCVLDADALFAVSKDKSILKKCKVPIIVTPHPGEMAMLEGCTTAEVQLDRLGIASRFAQEHGVTVVLKGAGTVIASSSGECWINTTGNPGMASGGVGDVLSGIIGGLLAQGLPEEYAAITGVYLHGMAGDIASEKTSETAMLATDLVDCIGDAVKALNEE